MHFSKADIAQLNRTLYFCVSFCEEESCTNVSTCNYRIENKVHFSLNAIEFLSIL